MTIQINTENMPKHITLNEIQYELLSVIYDEQKGRFILLLKNPQTEELKSRILTLS